MVLNYKSESLLDLMKEHYTELRSLAEQMWLEKEIPITISEWYIVSSIQEGNDTISKICRQIDISRQAAHKFINGLEGKGLVETQISVEHKGKKVISLTGLGKENYRETVALKRKIDQKIAGKLGSENFQQLKSLLEKEWI